MNGANGLSPPVTGGPTNGTSGDSRQSHSRPTESNSSTAPGGYAALQNDKVRINASSATSLPSIHTLAAPSPDSDAHRRASPTSSSTAAPPTSAASSASTPVSSTPASAPAVAVKTEIAPIEPPRTLTATPPFVGLPSIKSPTPPSTSTPQSSSAPPAPVSRPSLPGINALSPPLNAQAFRSNPMSVSSILSNAPSRDQKPFPPQPPTYDLPPPRSSSSSAASVASAASNAISNMTRGDQQQGRSPEHSSSSSKDKHHHQQHSSSGHHQQQESSGKPERSYPPLPSAYARESPYSNWPSSSSNGQMVTEEYRPPSLDKQSSLFPNLFRPRQTPPSQPTMPQQQQVLHQHATSMALAHNSLHQHAQQQQRRQSAFQAFPWGMSAPPPPPPPPAAGPGAGTPAQPMREYSEYYGASAKEIQMQMEREHQQRERQQQQQQQHAHQLQQHQLQSNRLSSSLGRPESLPSSATQSPQQPSNADRPRKRPFDGASTSSSHAHRHHGGPPSPERSLDRGRDHHSHHHHHQHHHPAGGPHTSSSTERHKRRRSSVGQPTEGPMAMVVPPAAPAVETAKSKKLFTRFELLKASIRPHLLTVDSSKVQAVLKGAKERRDAYVGSFAWNPFVDTAELIDGELLRSNVGAKLRVSIRTRWLRSTDPSVEHHWTVSDPSVFEQEQKEDPLVVPADQTQGVPDDLWDFDSLRDRKVWGTDVYTDDSDVLAMLLHTGWLRMSHRSTLSAKKVTESAEKEPVAGSQPDGTIVVDLLVAPTLLRYQSSERQGLKSRSWGNGHDGVSLIVERAELVTNKVDDYERARTGKALRRALATQAKFGANDSLLPDDIEDRTACLDWGNRPGRVVIAQG